MDLTPVLTKVLLFFLFIFPQVSAVTHTLQYLYTGVTGINFPEFTVVGLVDGQHFLYYDSNTRKAMMKTEWIKKTAAALSDYWSHATQDYQYDQDWFKDYMATAVQSFNQTKGVHTVQYMYGCELDDDNTTRRYAKYGYNGEDFVSLDLESVSWSAVKPQGVITVDKCDATEAQAQVCTNFLEDVCIERLKVLVSYGRATLERKDPPTASVIQKHSPSPEVVCHATGFFPKAVTISWRKDGEDVNEDVELRETLPNQDGSFQKISILKVPAEELEKHTYTCVIQHSSLKEELVLKVPKGGGLMAIIIAVVVALVLVAIAGIMVWKKKNPGFKPVSQNSTSCK
ncbi:BOLA class I histocompatibility antigen, alpha chain BL3-7-like isoform X2 [Hemibagrus wyckioides]|nr:BOLA class I histocompatibility antigen, alpha chain BL3-7-like isoform X2 [Hemibagrus wyckioides]